MNTTRRTVQQGVVVTGGAVVAGSFFRGPLATLVQGPPPANTAALIEDRVPTTCWIGKQDCGMLAVRVNGRVIKFEGDPKAPRNRGTLCPKGIGQIMAVYDPNRVKAPLIRTNEKGVPGQWRQASWDEALTLAGNRIKDARARDPRLLIWQKGRSKQERLYDDSFVRASGATKLGHGAYCSDAGYRAAEYTLGPHAVMHPDFRHTRYVLSWGWNITNAGGNKLCWITWPQQMLEAKERGLKIVAIDPRLRSAGPFAQEWLPIRPATDLALALALCNALIQQGTFDRDYLASYTNAPFLVKEDGLFLRVNGKEQVWDQATGAAQPFDAPGITPALEGDYTVDGAKVQPAFQVFKQHVTQYTPEWAAGVCGFPAAAIRKVAQELGQNAMIGSTTVVDGIRLPYRPVSIMAYHMAQQELGFQAIRAMLMIPMLLGAVEAVGGQRIDWTWKVHGNYQALDEIKIKDPPYNIVLKDSKYFPINSGNPSVAAKVMLNPQKYGVDYTPEVMIVHMSNPAVSFASQPDIFEAYKRFKFIAVIDPWLSKTADLFADVVLPAATVEKYEGPISATDGYTDATTMRLPPMQPLFQSRGEIDIYLDLCEKAGILYGPGGYLDEVNKGLGLKDPYTLPLDKRPTVRDIMDRWAKSQGLADGITFFEKNGVQVKGPVPARSFYGYAADPPFGGIRHRLYGESLLRYRNEMQAKGADQVYWQDYTALPTWRPATMTRSPGQYDLHLVSFKMVEFKQGRASQIPLLAELAPKQRLEINPQAARVRGLKDGDEVWVESHNAITGETRRVKVAARLTEAIRPDTVGMPHHYGEVANHPWAKGQGPTPNSLFFTGEGYVANTQDQSFHVKVRVYKVNGNA